MLCYSLVSLLLKIVMFSKTLKLSSQVAPMCLSKRTVAGCVTNHSENSDKLMITFLSCKWILKKEEVNSLNWSKIDSAVAIKIFNYKELSHMLLGYENGADGCVCVQMFTIESVTLVWPQWWSWVYVSQQWVDFSKKISKKRMIFCFDFHRCSHGPSKIRRHFRNKSRSILKLSKNIFYKKCGPKLIFFNEIFFLKKIQTLLSTRAFRGQMVMSINQTIRYTKL